MEGRVLDATLDANNPEVVLCPYCHQPIVVDVKTKQTMHGKIRRLVLPPAWNLLDALVEGLPVWGLSNRGKSRERQGKSLTNRRSVRSAPAEIVHEGRLPNRHVPGESWSQRAAMPELPIIVVCPKCDRVCRFDAARLRINA